MKVFDLAKRVGMPSKAVLEVLRDLGVVAKSHMSILTDKAAARATEEIARRKRAPLAPAEKKTRVLIKKPKPPAVEIITEPLPQPVPSIEPVLALATPKVTPAPPHPVSPPTPAVATPNVVSSPPATPPPAARPAPLAARMETAAVHTRPVSVEREKEGMKGGLQVPAARPGSPAAPVGSRRPEGARGPAQRGSLPLAGAPPRGAPEGSATERPLKPKKAQKFKEEGPLDGPVVSQTVWQSFKGLRHREERGREVLRSSTTPLDEITKPRKRVIKLSEGLTVKEFAELIGQRPGDVIKQLMEIGGLATINQPIDLAAAVLIAEGRGLKAEVVQARTETELLEEVPDDPASLRPRPPVVTIMGHVDHGKTSLLDAIRETKVTQQEAGGITQHIGAYTVDVGAKRVVFLDTPGHEAFTAMRARGAQVTDIVVLVVAADDGVMPQTIEAVAHARAANVPVIVAVNKIDKPEASVERVKRALAEQGLLPEAWGGKTIFAEVSAKKKIGLDHLLEMILLQAEVLELRANPACPARGAIIEARMDRGHGPMATVLVQKGTLRVGDSCVTGAHAGRVRALIDHLGHRVEAAGPATPLEVIGLSGVPAAGDPFVVVEDEQVAKEIALARQQRRRSVELGRSRKVSLEDLLTRIREGTAKELSLIVKADVQGSAEVLKDSLQKLGDSPVKVRLLHCGVGGITETDVLLASASNAIIVGFHTQPDPAAAQLAEREKVEIRVYDVIYDVMKAVRAAMEGLLEPILQERIMGRAEVRKVFTLPKAGTVAGCYVVDGTVVRAGASARIFRSGQVVSESKLASLKRFKDDVREVQTGYECGIGLEHHQDIQVGDIIEVYVQEKVAATLEAPS